MSPTRREAPLFTVAIPTYNRAQWLQRCVASALSQSFSSYEVIVSDNASTDSTADVLARLADRRLTVFRQASNVGPIANWNACLAAANGTYVVMLSDDDMVAPHFLERCSSVSADSVDLPVIVGLGGVLNPHTGWRKPAILSRRLHSGVCCGTELLGEFLRGNISPQMCTVAMNAGTLRSRGGFPDGWPHTGDLASWIPLLLGGNVGFVNESCGTYCSHDHTQTARLPLDVRLKDIERLGCVIVGEAIQQIHNPLVLDEITRLVPRYVARNCVGHMASERRSGASRGEVARTAWARRRQLSGAEIADLGAFVRPLALFVLPLWLTDRLTRARRRLRSAWAKVVALQSSRAAPRGLP
ncbi:MAG TPA: glycosyltransferase family A protein [Propionibacteriaceae bacterium]|nr:glycosyltransferase family A protein [Propionibacteriaceae bacterium]